MMKKYLNVVEHSSEVNGSQITFRNHTTACVIELTVTCAEDKIPQRISMDYAEFEELVMLLNTVTQED